MRLKWDGSARSWGGAGFPRTRKHSGQIVGRPRCRLGAAEDYVSAAQLLWLNWLEADAPRCTGEAGNRDLHAGRLHPRRSAAARSRRGLGRVDSPGSASCGFPESLSLLICRIAKRRRHSAACHHARPSKRDRQSPPPKFGPSVKWRRPSHAFPSDCIQA